MATKQKFMQVILGKKKHIIKLLRKLNSIHLLLIPLIFLLIASNVWAAPVDTANRVAEIAGTVIGSIVFVGIMWRINPLLGILFAIGAIIVIFQVLFK